jgi:cohesin complex subunit SA-1/2
LLLIRLTEQLLEKVKHEILFDEVLLPWLIEWVTIMTTSQHRGTRHTGTEAAMTVMGTLATLVVEVRTAKAAKERLQAGKKKKDAMGAALTQDIERLSQRAARLTKLAGDLFDGVFLHRYRDVCEAVRVCCITAVGKCIERLPEHFLTDTYLKYLGCEHMHMPARQRARHAAHKRRAATARRR